MLDRILGKSVPVWSVAAIVLFYSLGTVAFAWYCAGGAIFGLVAIFLGGVYLLSLLSPPLWPFAMSLEGIAIASVFAMLYLVGRVYAESHLQRD
jgi:hypothetical protein